PPPAHPQGNDAPAAPAGTGAETGSEVGTSQAGRFADGPYADWPTSSALALGLLAAILLAGTFSTISTSLLRALLPQNAPPPADSESEAAEGASTEETFSLGPGETEPLAAGAGLVAFAARATAAALMFLLATRLPIGTDGSALRFVAAVTITGCFGGVLLHLTTLSIPLAIAQSHADSIARRGVPRLAVILVPMAWVARGLTAVRRVFLRAVGTPDANYGTRRLVEGFRAMVEGAELKGDLGAETRELIANVIDFGAADAAEVMTPRTEIEAIEADSTLEEAIAVFASSGFSRIPVYVETVDTIIGTLTALEAAKAVAEGRLASTSIRSVMRPPLLVPETQLVPELLGNFREQRQKMAIVVDEYGGTAGLVTLADIIAEIVGHVQDEFEDEEPPPFQRLADGRVQIDASQHVADINEEVGLDLPEEEDYETLAGFVLSELGRFPSVGESFIHDGIGYEVVEANDRRVLKVVLSKHVGTLDLASERHREGRAAEPDSSAAAREGQGAARAEGRTSEQKDAAGAGPVEPTRDGGDRSNHPPIAS
ncbi:MAG: hemolysin family protein, partial [Planctomycetota bacterium]